MPPKSSNKKNTPTAFWYHCEICQAHIPAKDRDTHEKVCPITADASDNEAVEYVRDGEIYTCSLEQRCFAAEELNTMPQRFSQQILFISEGAMNLAKLHIGQEVVVTCLSKPELVPLVRLAWPIPERLLTSIYVNEEDFKLYWQEFKKSNLKISKLPKNYAEPARLIQVELLEIEGEQPTLSENQLKEMSGFLALELKRLIFTNGSQISTNFFNKLHKYKVLSWLPLECENLADNLAKLQLTDERKFFKIIVSTRVEITCSWLEPLKELQQMTITKLNIGGLADQIKLVEETIDLALGFRQIPRGLKVSRGLLIYGPTGCGKTLICEAMMNKVKQQKTLVIKINSGEVFSKYLGETEKNLLVYFEQAYAHFPQPSLIIIEDVHNLCSKLDSSEVAKRVAIALLSLLDAMHTRRSAQRTFVLATTSQLDQLHAGVRRAGRLDCEVEIGAPSVQGRLEILNCMLGSLQHDLMEEDIANIAQLTHAFTGADLANLIFNASMQANTEKLRVQHLEAALTQVKPSAMREVLIENPQVSWRDIGGQEELKLKLQQAIEWPLQFPEKFKRLGIKPPRGILMFGPPGCSKTMVAKALATESKLNFLSIKGPELFSMWVGESERAVRDVFRKARQVAPSIVFFDEIDAISSERGEAGGGGGGSSVKERVLTQLLTELDGVETLENVTIVAATNRPDMIDKALLRPGRIDRIIYVGLPNEDARRDIFRIKLSIMPVDKDVDIEKLVKLTNGYSGAEIQAVCQEAALKTLDKDLNATHVCWAQFEYALKIVRPRTSPDLLKLYEDYIARHK